MQSQLKHPCRMQLQDRECVMQAQKRAAAEKKRAQAGCKREMSAALKALNKLEDTLTLTQQQLTALQSGGLVEFRRGALVCSSATCT